MTRRRSARGLALVAVAMTAACSLDITTESPLTTAVSSYTADGMEFTASVANVPGEDRTVSVTMRVENRSSTEGQSSILGGNCMIRVRLYNAQNGALRWSHFDEIEACQEPLKVFALQAGEVENVTSRVSVDVGGGTYFVTATIEHLGTFPSSLVELVAGNITLD